MVLRIEFVEHGKVVREERFDLKVGKATAHVVYLAIKNFFNQMGWLK